MSNIERRDGRALTTVPFAGFYDTVHSEELLRALEGMFEDDHGDCVGPELLEMAWSLVDWHAANVDYAKTYVFNVSWLAGINIIFDKMISPREYNFYTDRIFAWIDRQDLYEMLFAVDFADLDKLIRARLTSRSGFVSWYSNSLDQWPESLDEWDHNQIGTLLQCYLDSLAASGDLQSDCDRFDWWAEFALMEDDRDNGVMDSIIWDASSDGFARLENIARHLRERRSRRNIARRAA